MDFMRFLPYLLVMAGVTYLIRAVPFRLRPLRVPAQLLVVSLAAQTASLPVVLHSFGRFGLCFLLNLPWLPVLGFFVLPLAALGFPLPTEARRSICC